MKKIVRLLIALNIVFVSFSTIASAESKMQVAFDSTFCTVKSDDESYRSMQGGCMADGGYYFCIMIEDPSDDSGNGFIYTPNGSQYYDKIIYIGHGNDMTYDTLNNYLTIVATKENGQNSNKIFNMNASTLQTIDEKTITAFNSISGVAFNKEYNQYLFASGNSFAKYTSYYSPIGGKFTLTRSGDINQGIDCDKNFIYTLQCNNSNTKAYLQVFSWDTHELLCEYTFNTSNNLAISGHSCEAENVSRYGRALYFGCNINNSNTDAVFKWNLVYGDANDDNSVTAADVLIIRQYVAEITEDLHYLASDVNDDGKITAADVLLIRQFIAEIIPEL